MEASGNRLSEFSGFVEVARCAASGVRTHLSTFAGRLRTRMAAAEVLVLLASGKKPYIVFACCTLSPPGPMPW